MSNNIQLQDQVAYCLEQLKRKLSMPNDTMQIRNSVMYLPNYPVDLIQRIIVESQNYWEIQSLNKINRYLCDRPVIVDIGANIGNNALYWAVELHAKRIYAFEPIKTTYDILQKNIELNGLTEVIIPQMVGLSDENIKASIKTYSVDNIGGTNVKKDELGNINLITLDSLDIKENIDMIKIDAESCEVEVLMGGLQTLKKHKPLVVIESFRKNQSLVNTILTELSYTKVENLTDADFIYKYTGV